MSDQGDDLTDESNSLAVISHRGILVKMGVVVGVGAILGFAFVSAKAGTGLLVGGVLAFANYFWQRHSLKVIFDRAVDGKQTRFLALRYILRYVALGAALALIYLSQTVSIVAVPSVTRNLACCWSFPTRSGGR